MLKFKDFITSDKAKKPHYLVIGHPIGHSLSPLMHRIALQHHKIEADYLAIDLSPGETAGFISWINQDAFSGANITIPYKKEFLPVADELDETARSAGALNTLVKSNNVIRGFNTDVDGFRQPLEQYRERLKGESVIIFGTGGASQAVIVALEQLEVEQIVMVSRNPGNRTAGDVQDHLVFCSYQEWQAYAAESVMIVNTTPLGMYPAADQSPVDKQDVHLLEQKICYDLVYNPAVTQFIHQAEQAGAEIIGGLEMFIGQGNRAFQLWTGKEFPVRQVQSALATELKL